MSGVLLRFLAAVVVLAWTVNPGIAAGETPSGIRLDYSMENDRGYFIGDLVKISYRAMLPPNLRLGKVSLPDEEKPTDEWVEVRGKRIRETVRREGRIYEIEMTYQIFSASERADNFRIPEVPFSYGPGDAPGLYSSAFPSIPVVISPLTPAGVSFKPLILWSWRSSSSETVRKIGLALFLCSGIMLAFLIRNRTQRRSPFDSALKRLSMETKPASALTIFRNALNEKAEKAVFLTNVEDFFRTFPRARAYEEEVISLIHLSDEWSFNPESGIRTEGLPRRVGDVLRKLRRSET